MIRKRSTLLAIAAILFSSLACQFVTGQSPTEEPTTAPAVIEISPTDTIEPAATEDFSAATEAAQQAAQEMEQATKQAEEQAAQEAVSAEKTKQAEAVLAETAAVEIAATALAENMYSDILKLQSEGVLTKTEGATWWMILKKAGRKSNGTNGGGPV